MRREARDLTFTLTLLGVVAWAAYQATTWNPKAALFPLAVSVPVLGMLVLQLATQARGLSSGQSERSGFHFDLPPHAVRRRMASAMAWLLGFAAAVWILGFALGGTLATLAHLRLAMRERWGVTVAITLGVALAFWALVNVLHIPFPRGLLQEVLLR